MVSTRSTRSNVASPRNDWISWTSHWKSSVVSGVSGRIQPAPRSRTAPMRWSLRQTPTRCRVGLGGRAVRSVSQRIELTVTLATLRVKRYTPRNQASPGRIRNGTRTDPPARADPRARPVLPAPGPRRIWRARRARGTDGTRNGRRKEMAHQGGDARRDRRLPIAARPARDPGRHLDLVHPWWLLGGVGGRLGVHPPQLRHRGRAGRALRPLRRPAVGHRDLLRREPRRHRADPALLLSPGQARHGGLAPVGARRRRLRRHARRSRRGGVDLPRLGRRRHSLLRLAVPRAGVHLHDVLAAARRPAGRRSRRRRSPGRDAGQALHVLPEGRLSDLRERARDRTLSREGTGPADRVAQRARVPRRRRHGHDEPGAGRHHRHVRGVPRRGIPGRAGRDGRYLPAVLSAGPHRGSGAGALPHEPQRAGLHQGRVRRCDRDDPGRLCPPRPDRHRRLAHGARHAREPRRAVPLESQQPPAHRRRGRDRADRVPAAPTDVGLREIGASMSARKIVENWKDIVGQLLKIGATAYGGPAIMGIMQVELQEKRQWVSKERFVEGVSLVNMLPGATAAQLSIFLGYARGGWWGGLLGWLCFVLPGFFVLLALTMGYAALGVTPVLRGALYGLGPVVMGIYLVAVYRLGKAAMSTRSQVLIAVAAAVAALASPLGVAGILLLAGGVGLWLFHSKKLGVTVLVSLAACLAVVHLVARSTP